VAGGLPQRVDDDVEGLKRFEFSTRNDECDGASGSGYQSKVAKHLGGENFGFIRR